MKNPLAFLGKILTTRLRNEHGIESSANTDRGILSLFSGGRYVTYDIERSGTDSDYINEIAEEFKK